MKRYSVADLRRHMARALDEAERGGVVFVERRGTRFRIAPEAPRKRRTPKASVEVLDPALLGDDWGWQWSPGRSLRFRAGKRSRK